MNQIKRTLITGASSGIGAEFAKIFAENGKSLILTARSEDKLTKLKLELESKYSVKVDVIVADLASPDGTTKIFEATKALGCEVENLVNNAGLGLFGVFGAEKNKESELTMIEVNIVALTKLCQAFLPAMLARRNGRILNVASTASFQPGPLMAIYFATKAYVLHFSEAIAEELAGTGVTVTALCPGPTASGFQEVADLGNSKLFKDKQVASAREVAEFGYKSLMVEKRVAIEGWTNYLLAQTSRFVPRNLVTHITKKMQEPSI